MSDLSVILSHPSIKTNKDLVETILFVVKKPLSVSSLLKVLSDSGIKGIKAVNIAPSLSRSSLIARTEKGYTLTKNGESQIKERLVRNGVTINSQVYERDLSKLRDLLNTITSEETKSFIEEAIRCFEYNLYRAAIVLSWVGAISVMQDAVLNSGLKAFNIAGKAQNQKWKDIKTKDGFAHLKENDFLVLMESANLLGKNVKAELIKCLTTRNGCGHPSTLQLSEHAAANHLEILILNVFSKYSA